MPWQEVSPGRFERALDPSEFFFWAINAAPKPKKRERWSLYGITAFKTDLARDELPRALRNAWRVARYEYPVLAASLERDKKVYIVPTEEEVEQWLDKTVVIEPPDADSDEVFANYETTPLAKLHWFPRSDELMIRTPHWRADGTGLLLFTDRLFDILANPPSRPVFGDEGNRLPESLEEIVPDCRATPEKRKRVQERWREGIAATFGRTIGLPIKPVGTPGATRRRTYQFSVGMTSAIVAACKRHNLSVTTALAASLVCVTQKNSLDPLGKKQTMFSTMPHVNLRAQVPPSPDGKKYEFTVMIVTDPVAIDLQDFEGNARQLKPFYARELDTASGSEALSLFSAWQESLTKLWTTPPPAAAPEAPPPPMPVQASPSLNSLGVMDRQLKNTHSGKHLFEVMDFRFAVEVLGGTMLIYAWTYRGRLRLNPYYNEASYDAEYVQFILDSLKDAIVSNLGLTWEAERAYL